MKADNQEITRLLRTARGQIDGILEMIAADRYCIDISHQLLAAQAVLSKSNRLVLQAHLESCVQEAFQNGNYQEKIHEILSIIEKMNR